MEWSDGVSLALWHRAIKIGSEENRIESAVHLAPQVVLVTDLGIDVLEEIESVLPSLSPPLSLSFSISTAPLSCIL